MSQAHKIEAMSNPLEGGMFYPAGYLIAGMQDRADAERACAVFRQAGYDSRDCFVVAPETMLSTAKADLETSGIIAILGSGLQVRQRQMDLAAEGCWFLLVYAPSEAERTRVMRVLERVPLRYAIHYRRFTVEDLIERMPSAQGDARSARTTGKPDG